MSDWVIKTGDDDGIDIADQWSLFDEAVAQLMAWWEKQEEGGS